MTPGDLKKLRKAAGLSQTDLGNRLGMSLRGIQALESGESTIRELHRLALIGAGLLGAGSSAGEPSPREDFPGLPQQEGRTPRDADHERGG